MDIPNPPKSSHRLRKKKSFSQSQKNFDDVSMSKVSEFEIFIQKQKSAMARAVNYKWNKKFSRLKTEHQNLLNFTRNLMHVIQVSQKHFILKTISNQHNMSTLFANTDTLFNMPY